MKNLWFDIRNLKTEQINVLVPLATNNGYSGIFMLPSQKTVITNLPKHVSVLLYVTSETIEEGKKIIGEYKERSFVVFSKTFDCLATINNVEKGLLLSVDDRESLDYTVEMTEKLKHVIIEFKDTTNIPLELVLAYSQKNNCQIYKKVAAGEDGWIASMVMEMGSHGVLLETVEPNDIIALKTKVDLLTQRKMPLIELTIIESTHIGIGDRICIDTTSYLKEDEGFILGSTSTGGILVSSETHFLPYMELRPFRVNAGALHLYAWNEQDKTDYLSELKAGSSMMTVDSKGNTRVVAVGRIKMEQRPLLLLRAKDNKNNEVNVILQDDWHVRVIGIKGEPLNCTELQPGDKVLGYTCQAGRHVGIKINEHIAEK